MVLFHADAEILFGADVSDIQALGSVYEIRSSRRTLRARTVIVANGMGAPNECSFVADERCPHVVLGDDFIANCFHDHAYADSAGTKRVAVIGAGDTANCVLEYLLPLVYPNKSYGLSRSSARLPREIVWLGQRAAELRQFFFANKFRYCHSGGVVELFWTGDGPLELPDEVWSGARAAIRCIPEKLQELTHTSDAIRLETEKQAFEVDLVIDCSGRANPLSSLLFRRGYQFVEGDIALWGGRWDDEQDSFVASPRHMAGCRVACRIDGESVFLVGSACPLRELIPDDEAKDGSMEHQEQRTSLTNSQWSLEHTLPRSVALAQQLAATGRLE